MITYQIIVWLSLLAAQCIFAHMSMLSPVPRGGLRAEQYGGTFDSRITEWIGYPNTTLSPSQQHLDTPCLRFSRNTPISLRPGSTIGVTFYTSDMRNMSPDNISALIIAKQPQTLPAQVRHGGGECHFFLSSNEGVTGREIAVYRESCPDIHYEWPIRIPIDVEPCSMCVLVWYWFAYDVPQFYQNCVDIQIEQIADITMSEETTPVPTKYAPYKVAGDGKDNGAGPLASDIQSNLDNAKKNRAHRHTAMIFHAAFFANIVIPFFLLGYVCFEMEA